MANLNNANGKKDKLLLLSLIIILISLVSFNIYNKYYFGEQTGKIGKTIKQEFNFDLKDNKNKIQLKALNGYITVSGYEGNEIKANVEYSLKEKGYKIDFYKDKKKGYILDYDENKFKKVSINILIPFNYVQTVDLVSLHSKVKIKDLQTNDLSIISSNGKIYVESFKGEKIFLENLNNTIFVDNSIMEKLKVENVNGRIDIKNCDVKYMEGINTNGDINIFRKDSLYAYNNYKWHIKNQQGDIAIELISDEINYNINAKTENGDINIKKDNLEYTKKQEDYVCAKTQTPEQSYKSLNLSLETSNSSIILK